MVLNPWQLGNWQWEGVAAKMVIDFKQKFTKRVDLLIEKHEKHELKLTGGTEEMSERSCLLDSIINLKDGYCNRSILMKMVMNPMGCMT